MRLALAVAAFAVASGSVGLSACERTLVGPPLCSARAPCSGETRCVQGRCRPGDGTSIAPDADRLVFEPVDEAWLGSPDAGQGRATLGSAEGRATTLLRFSLRLPAERRVQRAVLVLDPAPECEVRPGRVRVVLAPVRAPWRSSQVSLAKLPPLGGYGRAAEVLTTPPRPLRIDVTELVADWQAHPSRHHGLALRGDGTSPSGLCVATGEGAGRGPRLDVYLWPPGEGEGGAGGRGGGGGNGGGGHGGAGGDG